MRSKPRRQNKNQIQQSYGQLEDRRVLVTYFGFDAATGTLAIDMTSNGDSVVIDRGADNLLINGSEDTDSQTAGTQTVNYADVRDIVITNAYGKLLLNQEVTFEGDFTSSAQANLQNIFVNGAKNVTFNGDYELAGNLTLSMNDSNRNGMVVDGDNASLVVNGTTLLDTRGSMVMLDNVNDFVGPVSISAQQDVKLVDANDLTFSTVNIDGDLLADAEGQIGDVEASSIFTSGDAMFNAGSILLGENGLDTVNFRRFNATATGSLELNEDSNVILLAIDATTLTVRTPGGIFDGRTTDISVDGLATFEGDARIRIGENGTDTFNAGSINFKSGGHVHIWENSGMVLAGDNTALKLDLFAETDLVDLDDATLNVDGIAGFAAGNNVVLGDTLTDQVNTGAMYFFAGGDFNYTEDSDVHIIEEKNESNRLFLTASGAVTDQFDSRINVADLAEFNATSVNLGDGLADEFNAGSVNFTTTGQFRIAENSDTNFVGDNSASNLLVASDGDITNIADTLSTATKMTIGTTASFAADNIFIGTQTNDEMQFGALTVSAPNGIATVQEDGDILLAGNSGANTLNLTSTGQIQDASTSNVFVNGNAAFTATDITLGDGITDQFNAFSMNIDATGDVFIDENSSINLHGLNNAGSMTLVANGNITDSLEAATQFTGLLSLEGGLINLGSEVTDFLTFGSITFVSEANTFVTADSDILITGTSLANNQLILNSAGDITDDIDADTRARNRAVLTGVDVIIGELASDCFDIINGGENSVFVTATGTRNVDVAC